MRIFRYAGLSVLVGIITLIGSFYIPVGTSKAEDFNCPDGTFLNIDLAKGSSCVLPTSQIIETLPIEAPIPPATNETGCR